MLPYFALNSFFNMLGKIFHMHFFACINLLLLILLVCPVFSQKKIVQTDLLIVGGGASGIAAGIQAARMGVQTTIIEETDWLGGMLTAAGVSAIDGNHKLPSGIWGEFRDSIYAHYGGPDKVATGWVSHTLFEPSVGNRILQNIAKSLPELTVYFNSAFKSAEHINKHWVTRVVDSKNEALTIKSKFLIDATELGAVMAALDVHYDLGMESKTYSDEQYAPDASNDIVQDLTYTVILQDYGKPSVINEPPGYSPTQFDCACEQAVEAEKPSENCLQMLDYAKLPNNKYLINWPNCGNDFYVNLAKLNEPARLKAIDSAKNISLQFVYYIQTELGFSHLGIAENEFPSKDNLPLMPYHRESRRVKGKVRLNVNHLENPFKQQKPLYRTGIAVGDYPIDHHHTKNELAPEIDFINIKVPSYNVPLGALIPEKTIPQFIVAEKNISVSNIVNGTTRLQPVVLGIGQAAGTLAAYCLINNVTTSHVPIRKVQQTLLAHKAYLMPYIDVSSEHAYFESIHKIGATGIIKGVGIPYKWANETWFYPNNFISEYEMVAGLQSFYDEATLSQGSGSALTFEFLVKLAREVDPEITENKISQALSRHEVLKDLKKDGQLNRLQASLLIHELLNPFDVPINFQGNLLNKNTSPTTSN